MQPLYLIKIGGGVIDEPQRLEGFLQAFAAIPGRKLLVHGGGKLATDLAGRMGIPQQLVNGRRITDEATLRVVTMVYAGWINKSIVAGLQVQGCRAFGLSGADGNLIQAHKRKAGETDYGFAGDIDAVDADLLHTLLEAGLSPVLAPITHDGKGQLLNTNADTIAQETAKALSRLYEVKLVFAFDKTGVLRDPENDGSVIRNITPPVYEQLKADGTVSGGMLPKLDNAFAALASGVRQVLIGRAEDLTHLCQGEKGTLIHHG